VMIREPVVRARRALLLTALVVAWTAAPAHAQWVVSPYVGTNIGDVKAGQVGVGGSVGYLGGLIGFEFDFDRYGHFFKDADVSGIVPDLGTDLDTDAMSFMGNVVAPIRIQGATNWRPYGAAGLGVIHAWFDSANDLFDADQNNLGFNVGGGVMYSLNDRVGLRGDLRYFHALVDEDKHEGGFFKDYAFWRAAFGVTFRFPR
jgi:opacity protein-like surface antigen